MKLMMVFVFFQDIVLPYPISVHSRGYFICPWHCNHRNCDANMDKKKKYIFNYYTDTILYSRIYDWQFLPFKKTLVAFCQKKSAEMFTCKLKFRDIRFYMQTGEQGQRSLSFIYLFLQISQLSVHPLLTEQKKDMIPLYLQQNNSVFVNI